MKRLRVISGGQTPKKFRSSEPGGVEPLVCACGSTTTVEVRTNRMIIDGEITEGQRQLLCSHCHAVLWSALDAE